MIARLSEAEEALGDANEGASRVRRIVEELRRFAHPRERRTRFDVARAAESAVRLCENVVEQRANLVKAIDGTPHVLGDEAQFVQVIVNLLVNAAEAIPENAARRDVSLWVYDDGSGAALVEVRDTGAGIAPEILPRIFDPFFTTKPVGKGTGLGLAICHRIVEAHGGRIEVKSRLGEGTTFRVQLPGCAKAA